MKGIDIKGKTYITVNERLKYFRENYKGWSIVTEIINSDSEICLMKAEILDEYNDVMATGHAYEEAQSSFINKTSHVENCETSAIGRALGCLGIGIDESVATFDEVATAINKQAEDKPWLSDKDFNRVMLEMNKESEKAKRSQMYQDLFKSYRIARRYKTQFEEIVEAQDIKV